MASDDEIRVRGLGSRSRARLGVGVVTVGAGVWWIVLAATPGGYLPGRWIAGVGGVLFVYLSSLLLVEAFRGRHPLELDGDVLLIASGLRKLRLPLAEVTGVGLLFQWISGRNGLPAGWYLNVWDAAGKQHRIEECRVDSHWKAADYRTGRPRETSEELAASEAGQMVRRIYDRVWAVQGSSGPLATRQEQKMRNTTRWTRDIDTYAWWSPDGEMGELTWPAPAYDDDE